MRSIVSVLAVVLPAAGLLGQVLGPVAEQESLIPGTNMHRCGTPSFVGMNSPADHPDCDLNNTNPLATYAPTNLIRIPVVVHVIQQTASGPGNLTDTQVQSQITVLNEDFRALSGTAGAPGVDTMIEFFLATTDPSGNPTTGITRHTNATWFADGGSYWTTVNWDSTRYLNIYTNNAGGGGVLGYVPDLPQGGSVLGTSADRVVILYSAFGRPSPAAPYNLGRTCTHEVGHSLGLFHTFQSGCGTAACYTTGDRICDTNAEAAPQFGCPTGATSCGNVDPISNYMDYTDDACMHGFTQEQARRMRCTLMHYRPTLGQPSGPIAQAINRNGAGNLNGRYTTSAPRLGQTMASSCVVLGTSYGLGAIFGYLNPANLPLGTQTILVDIASPFIFQSPFVASGLILSWNTPIPNVAAFAGVSFSTQVVLLDATSLGLTNAMDLTIGS